MAFKQKETVEPSEQTLKISQFKKGRVRLRMVGTTPLYFNSMSVKTMRDLAAPKEKIKGKKQLTGMKHDPIREFYDSAYKKEFGETLLCFPAPGVKAAMATAALETENVSKASVQRLIFMPQTHIQIWGKPQLKTDIVRTADIKRTPDIRTRCYLPRWCAEVDIAYVQPTLSAYGIVSLLSNAGAIIGIGDFRQEKGRGSYGTFVVGTSDSGDDWTDFMPDGSSPQKVWDELMLEGRDVQQAAMNNPEYADDVTADLVEYVKSEMGRRFDADVQDIAAE
jgi:hypothetical protein